MKLSDGHDVTIQDVDEALAALDTEYKEGLERIKEELLYPARLNVKSARALLRKQIAVRRRKLTLLRDSLGG